METRDIVDLLKKKTREDPEKYNLFICGPSYGDSNQKDPNNKLRVYAYGGVLCKLPTDHTDPRGEITLLDKKYLKKNPSLLEKLQKVNGQRPGGKAKEDFLMEHLEALLVFMRDWASGTDEDKERSQQTIISRKHTNFNDHDHNGTVVCDFACNLPKSMGRPNFDLVTFSMGTSGRGIFTLVEYKCNARACGGNNGLAKHAGDMLRCVTDSTASDWCKTELLRRLGYMRKCELLQNCPAELERLTPEGPEKVDLRAAFLFTPGEGLRDREEAAALCEKHIPADMRDKFLYCFADDPETVNLSDMKNWKEFRGD